VQIDFSRILQHALRSWATYHSEDEIESGVFEPQLSVFGPESVARECLHLGNFGMFLEVNADGSQWIAVRGTKVLQNVIDNLQYNLEHAPELGLRSHEGYIALSRKAFDELRPRLRIKQAVRITGHSLGGAVAALLALRLVQAGYRVVEVVTFGAPKFTDIEGSVFFLRRQISLLRITNRGDSVPSLPPWHQYVHTGAEVHLHGDDPVLFDWISSGQAAVTHFCNGPSCVHPNTTLSHSVPHYLRNISAKLPFRDVQMEAILWPT